MSKLAAVLFIALLAAGARAQTPRSAEDFQERAAERYTRADYEGAIADFTQAIELMSRPWKGDPKRDPRRNNWSGAAAEADDGFGRARVLDPAVANVYTNRGVARLVKGDRGE